MAQSAPLRYRFVTNNRRLSHRPTRGHELKEANQAMLRTIAARYKRDLTRLT